MLAALSDEFKPLVMAMENYKETLIVDMDKNLFLQDVKFDQKQNQKIRNNVEYFSCK